MGNLGGPLTLTNPERRQRRTEPQRIAENLAEPHRFFFRLDLLAVAKVNFGASERTLANLREPQHTLANRVER